MKLLPVNILPLKEQFAEFLTEFDSTRGSNRIETKKNSVDRNGPDDKLLKSFR